MQTAKASLSLKQRLGRWLIPFLPFSRRTFEILRFEARCLTQRLLNLLNPAYHVRIKALRRMQGLAVNLGSGGRGLPGWINMDAEIDSEGELLYYVEAKFTGGNVPASADIGVANLINEC